MKRIDLKTANPNGFKAMLTFNNYLEKSTLTVTQKNLIKIRASQINGCAYCVDMHMKEAQAAGENDQRLYCLSVWRDTPFFTDEERAILALTEEVTLIQKRVSDETYQNAISMLGETKVSDVLLAIIIINSWNRLGVANEMMPA